MDFILELIVGLVAEALYEIIGYIVFDLLGRCAIKLVESVIDLEAKYFLPICVLLGLGLGGLSVGLFPHHVVKPSRFYGISLVVSPAIVGLLVHLYSSVRGKRGKETYRFEAFSYGFAFAFCFGLVRFIKLM